MAVLALRRRALHVSGEWSGPVPGGALPRHGRPGTARRRAAAARGPARRRGRVRQSSRAVRRRRLSRRRLRRPAGVAPQVPRLRRLAGAVRGGAGARRRRLRRADLVRQRVQPDGTVLELRPGGHRVGRSQRRAPSAPVRDPLLHLRSHRRRLVSDAAEPSGQQRRSLRHGLRREPAAAAPQRSPATAVRRRPSVHHPDRPVRRCSSSVRRTTTTRTTPTIARPRPATSRLRWPPRSACTIRTTGSTS